MDACLLGLSMRFLLNCLGLKCRDYMRNVSEATHAHCCFSIGLHVFLMPFKSHCFDLGHGSINVDMLTSNTHTQTQTQNAIRTLSSASLIHKDMTFTACCTCKIQSNTACLSVWCLLSALSCHTKISSYK